MLNSTRSACVGFCFRQAESCLKIAEMSNNLIYQQTFIRMADHWNGIAKECDGKLHPWTNWCHNAEVPEEYAAPSLFVAHFIATCFPDKTLPDPVSVLHAYSSAPESKK